MTTIAKIFIVVNFLLSVFFVGVAATVLHKTDDYRMKFMDEQKAKSDLEQEKNIQIDGLNSKNTELQRDRDSLKTAKDNLDVDKTRITEERDSLKNDLRESNGTKDRLSKTVENMQTQLSESEKYVQSIQSEKDKSITDLNDAMDAKRVAENDQRRLADQLEDEKSLVADLQKEIENVQGKLDEWSNLNEIWAGKGVNILGESSAIPAIDGRIANVNKDLGFVILSVGRKDHVEVGFEFVVSRGEEYLGDLIVDAVDDDTCSARMSFLKSGAMLNVGDSVTTRL